MVPCLFQLENLVGILYKKHVSVPCIPNVRPLFDTPQVRRDITPLKIVGRLVSFRSCYYIIKSLEEKKSCFFLMLIASTSFFFRSIFSLPYFLLDHQQTGCMYINGNTLMRKFEENEFYI